MDSVFSFCVTSLAHEMEFDSSFFSSFDRSRSAYCHQRSRWTRKEEKSRHRLSLQQSNWLWPKREIVQKYDFFIRRLVSVIATVSIVRAPLYTHKRRITFPSARVWLCDLRWVPCPCIFLTQTQHRIRLFGYFHLFHFVNNFGRRRGSHKDKTRKWCERNLQAARMGRTQRATDAREDEEKTFFFCINKWNKWKVEYKTMK